ncbi:hypothetical protein PHYSODRAFT_326510 [Phytophthora sojae]|uniref:Ankyrin repeat-containing domain n=1 Tax=Phytophthora sojae (strain P6497) TaxID=1094619 RepID=G4YUP6_PHYSP|nr:hypothetical protein PHYSODRAFT_326510 [Phytophthora sojae]EGZ25501.1 hypothetical protein PHYSODRAFT_326510 [Phytophthora sojae]|eukprot:XP_009520789.1 hypothetical protein PHYSODRAFT_326510 [Phytophthora sojae]
MPDVRKRTTSSSDSNKRARTRAKHQTTTKNYPRFRGARFPHKVEALPHVLDQIDVLLMNRHDALKEAARSGQVAWLNQLIHGGECSGECEALVAAASNGQRACVDALLLKFYSRIYVERKHQRALRKAVPAAGGNGHLDTLTALLQKQFNFYVIESATAVWETLEAATESGHLHVVRFLVQHSESADLMQKYNYNIGFRPLRSLARAIVAGHSNVVEFVLGLDAAWWDLVAAFAAAVDVGPPGLADRILDIYLRTAEDKSMLVQLAIEEGSVNAVKYLINHGHNQSDLGSISMTGTEVLVLLCRKKCASPESINRAFVSSFKIEMTRYLYENEEISSEAVVAAFKKATVTGTGSSKHVQDWKEITKFLLKDDRIPAQVIGKALVSAVSRNKMELVEVLDDDARITAEMAIEALVTTMFDFYMVFEAVTNGYLHIVQWLAAEHGHLEILKWLHTNGPERCSTKAMDMAAANGHLEIVRWLHESRGEGYTAAYGHLSVAKFLFENRHEGCMSEAMRLAASKGHLEVVQWLHANRSEGNPGAAMRAAATSEKATVVEWLCDIVREERRGQARIREAAQLALEANHSQLAVEMEGK